MTPILDFNLIEVENFSCSQISIKIVLDLARAPRDNRSFPATVHR